MPNVVQNLLLKTVKVMFNDDCSILESVFDRFVIMCQMKNIEYFEKTQQEGKVKQCFFFDPDGRFLFPTCKEKIALNLTQCMTH